MLEEKIKSRKIDYIHSDWEYAGRVIAQERFKEYWKKRIAKKVINKWKYQNG